MVTVAEWGWGASANPAWDLAKFLGLRAWKRMTGWEAKCARQLVDTGVIESWQGDAVRRWLRATDWSVILATLDADDDALVSSLADALFHKLGAAGTEEERTRRLTSARKVAIALWDPLVAHASAEMLTELNNESRDERVAALVEQIAVRCEAMDDAVDEWLRRAGRLEQDLGLKRWRVPLPRVTFDSPSTLLDARHAVVPFVGRADELGELGDWLAQPRGLAVRFIEGQGGAGKTRLAAELCRDAARAGWRCGFLVDRLTDTQLDRLVSATVPRLVVIDYADARHDLGGLLERLFQWDDVRHPCRVLFLERGHRGIGGSTEVNKVITEAGPVIRLDESPLALDERTDLFDAARSALSAKLGTTPADGRPELSAALFERVVMIAASAAVYASGDRPDKPLHSAAQAFDRLAEHEARYWTKTATRLADDGQLVPRETVRAAVVASGAVFGWSQAPPTPDRMRAERELAALLVKAEACQENEALPAAQWLLELYPGGRLPLDPLADHLIAKHLSPTAYAAAFAIDDPQAAQRAIPAIVRAAGASEKVREACHPKARSALQRLGEIASGHDEAWAGELFRLSLSVVPDPPASVVQLLRQMPTALPLRPAAVDFEQRAVDDLRRRAHQEPALIPDLAMSLNNLAISLAEVGRRTDALAPAEQAVSLYRELAATNPAYTPNLASSLNNLAKLLADLGDSERAAQVRAEGEALQRDDD